MALLFLLLLRLLLRQFFFFFVVSFCLSVATFASTDPQRGRAGEVSRTGKARDRPLGPLG